MAKKPRDAGRDRARNGSAPAHVEEVAIDLMAGGEQRSRIVVFSDIEMGGGGPADDFPHTPFLGELMTAYLDGPDADLPVDFVFNGDTFDFLKVSYQGAFPKHISAEVALGKVESVAAAHPKFFEAVRAVVEHPSGNKRVFFVVGNHDFELLFPEVQQRLREHCGGSEHVIFPGFDLMLGSVYLAHGCQVDPVYRMDVNRLFVEHNGEKILNIPWAAVTILDVAMPLQDLLYHHDRLRPKAKALELLPEFREVMSAKLWNYWQKVYWKDFRAKDPVHKISWSMVREAFRRSKTADADLELADDWTDELLDHDEVQAIVVGHLHRNTWVEYEGKKVIQLGCFRDEYWIRDEGRVLEPRLKPYLEFDLRGGRLMHAKFLEVQGPARKPGTYPESIFDVVPKLREMLARIKPNPRSAVGDDL
ncbi:MAG: metallophosphoesterase [Deltaproteobacteria bacterium]|nr:metallophosphoesterase [Deltaproteobacteria bacterium]MCB9478317.1 metallophosphoesterase [Deltaproteobacteria bacterium]MCB9489301.1 metallophosphoesterase [Deltaproteobacteria bacterium]